MEASIEFSREQQAQKSHAWSAAWAAVILSIPINIALIWLVERMNFTSAQSGAGVCGFFVALQLGKLWAKRRLRDEGLAYEVLEVRTLSRNATEFSGNPQQWDFSSSPTFSGLMIATVFIGLFGWWGWCSHVGATVLLSVLLLGFILFDLGDLWLRRGTATLRMDSAGITFWLPFHRRQKLNWSQVTECEIKTIHDNLVGKEGRFFSFKSREGKELMVMELTVRPWLNLEQLNQIEAEIKNRLLA